MDGLFEKTLLDLEGIDHPAYKAMLFF